MRIVVDGQLLSAESRAYDFDGNQGTSHTARFNVGGEIYPARTDEWMIAKLKPQVGEEGNITFELSSRKERIKLELVSFD